MKTIGNEFNVEGFFEYINNLSEDEYNIPHIYKEMIMSLIDEMDKKGEFKFKLPLSDNEVWIHLDNKDKILKTIDFLIGHFYRYEIYEFINDFNEIRKYYSKEY